MNRRRHTTPLVAAAFAWLLVGSVAAAQGSQPGSGAPVTAQERFQRGIDLFHEGDLDGAFLEFSRAYETSGNYRLLYNIAQVDAERHNYVAAIDRFRLYLNKGGEDIDLDRRNSVRQEIAVLSARIGSVDLVLNIDGADVLLNDVPQNVAGRMVTLRVNGGVTRLVVRKKGYGDYSKELTIAGGESQKLQVVLKKESADVRATTKTPPGPTAPLVEPRHNYTPFGVVLAGTALLGAATTVSGVLALNAERRLDTEFNTFPGDAEAQAGKRSDLSTLATVTDVLLGATIVAGGISLYLLLDPPDVSEEAGPDGYPAVTALLLRPSGIALLGSF